MIILWSVASDSESNILISYPCKPARFFFYFGWLVNLKVGYLDTVSSFKNMLTIIPSGLCNPGISVQFGSVFISIMFVLTHFYHLFKCVSELLLITEQFTNPRPYLGEGEIPGWPYHLAWWQTHHSVSRGKLLVASRLPFILVKNWLMKRTLSCTEGRVFFRVLSRFGLWILMYAGTETCFTSTTFIAVIIMSHQDDLVSVRTKLFGKQYDSCFFFYVWIIKVLLSKGITAAVCNSFICLSTCLYVHFAVLYKLVTQYLFCPGGFLK